MKGNQYKKLHPMHKGDRKYFCQHARMNLVRNEKHLLKKAVRIAGKKEIKEELE